MYDVRNVIRFELAQLVSGYRQVELCKVLFSQSFQQLELGLVDVVDFLKVIEKIYQIQIPNKGLIHSIEDLVSLICGDNLVANLFTSKGQ
ncbi:hypothetical protein [Adhaeribacter aquaticus]|uniref:hypothetical protein n=1 Tax=Adhaeribacter aquaticus TaxID=299567 RepID=UPI00042823D0|nr:hypothetical protein [Adhaeribacter aquaticus]